MRYSTRRRWIRRLALTFLGMLVVAVLALLDYGCASFKTKPGQRPPQLPVVESTLDGRYRVAVRVVNEGGRPYCSLPDASNTINCEFSYEWFEQGGLLHGGMDGYLYLNQPDAREACRIAMWTALGGAGEVEACARALLYWRFIVAPPVDPKTN